MTCTNLLQNYHLRHNCFFEKFRLKSFENRNITDKDFPIFSTWSGKDNCPMVIFFNPKNSVVTSPELVTLSKYSMFHKFFTKNN